MILVEGPDGAGKTTLVNQLCKEYGLQVGVRGTTNRDLLYKVTVPDTMCALARAVLGRDVPRIWDRLYYSDFVYAPIQKRRIAFNASQQMHVDKIIEALRCPIIVCLPPLVTVVNNEQGTHQMPGVHENLRRIYEDYYRMCYRIGDAIKAFPDHRIVYDYTRPSTIDEVRREIEDYLDERDERTTY